MTNAQIIGNIEEQVEHRLNTYQGWKALGFQVKKGEKAFTETMLWKKRKGKKREEAVEVDGESDLGFIKVKSYLFTEEQVEAIK